ncbi:MAG: thiamine-phosphate kinase [Candidatus Omnitrophota bacterium]
MKTIQAIGEFGLIDRIARRIKTSKNVIVGIGDDCAVLRYNKDKYLLLTLDMLIEGVHFTLKARPQQIGHKAIAASISDIASMGGVAKYAAISAGLRPCLSLDFADKLFAGISNTARRFKVDLIGGDTNHSAKLVIDVAMVGEVEKKKLVLRSRAKCGDIIFTTGTLGGSIYGKHLSFTPRIKESGYLVRNYTISSMIDISDGLAGDLWQICKASRVGAAIYENAIPLSPRAKTLSSALNDGEDFELLFTVPPRQAHKLLLKKPLWLKITRIGEITNRNSGIQLIDKRGRARALRLKGFRHF